MSQPYGMARTHIHHAEGQNREISRRLRPLENLYLRELQSSRMSLSNWLDLGSVGAVLGSTRLYTFCIGAKFASRPRRKLCSRTIVQYALLRSNALDLDGLINS